MSTKSTNENKLILVVDDDHAVRESLQAMLEASGFTVATVLNGQAAIERCRQTSFDVVLMDVDMPELNGLDATRQISQSLPDVGVLILTAYDREDFLFEALQAGASGYVLKAGSVDDLLHSIRTIRDGDVSPAKVHDRPSSERHMTVR